MEEQLDKHFSEFERLLRSKDYQQLSDQEKIMVNGFSSEEEYHKMRSIILSNAEIMDSEKRNVNPNGKILNNLLHRMKMEPTSKRRGNVLIGILNYRVPAYQLMICMAVLVLLMIFVGKREKMVAVDRPVYITRSDTIVKYINIEKKSVDNKTIKTNTKTIKTPGLIVNNKQEKPDTYMLLKNNIYSVNIPELKGSDLDLKEKIEYFKPKGRTMHDDSLLVKFLVKI